MTAPAGIIRKTKNNDNKHPRVSEEWRKGKRLGRPKQVFDIETKKWRKV